MKEKNKNITKQNETNNNQFKLIDSGLYLVKKNIQVITYYHNIPAAPWHVYFGQEVNYLFLKKDHKSTILNIKSVEITEDPTLRECEKEFKIFYSVLIQTEEKSSFPCYIQHDHFVYITKKAKIK